MTESDHRGAVLWGSLAAGFLVAQQVTGKATRDALFLSHHPATSLPLVTMASALVAVAAALVASRLLTSRSPQQIVPGLVGLNAALLLGLFLVTQAAPGLASVLVYLQVAATGGTLLSGYWSVVSERFDPWTAKKVVGRLGLGASLGGVVGGLAAFGVAGVAPAATMILLTAALNVGALVGLVRFASEARRPRERGPAATASAFATLRSTGYLKLIAVLVALGAVAEVLIDYVFKSRASAALAPGREMMTFFAAFHTAMGLLALGFQVILSRPALQGLGLAGTVALRPMAVAAASALGLLDPRLWAAALGRGTHDVLSNSLFRSGYELLYTPVPEGDKRATKQIVDVVFDKLGALVGGGVTLAAVRFLDRPDRALLFVAGGLSLVALSSTRRLHRGYVATLEAGLRAGKVRLDPEDVVDSSTRFTLSQSRLGAVIPRDPSPPPRSTVGEKEFGDPVLQQIAALRSGEAERVRGVLVGSGAGLDPALVPHLLPLVARTDVHRDVLRALRGLAPHSTGQILDCILDPSVDVVVRRRLPQVLKAAPSRWAAEGLLRGLEDPELSVRAACAGALAALLARAPDLRVPADVVFATVLRELQASGGEREGAHAVGVANEEMTLAQVFLLLSLVLDREPLRIAARAIRGPDVELRGTALEYLENVLPTDVRKPFLSRLEAPRREPARPLDDVLNDLMRSGGATSGPRPRRRDLRPRG